MNALLRAEVLKLRTTRTFIAFAALAVGTSLLIAGLVSLLTEPTQDSVLTDVFTSDTSSLFIIILAVVGISGEWRHRTITSSLLAAPDRVRFLAAKTLAFAVVGLLLSLSISISVAVLGFIILGVRDLPTPGLGELAAQVGHIASEAMLLGAFGVCVGALVRNQVVAVVGLLLLSFVVEPVLIGLVPHVFRYAPFVALPTAVSDIPADQAGLGGDVNLLAPGLAVLAMLAWISVTFTIAAVLLRARDLN